MSIRLVSSQARAMDRMFERMMGFTGQANPLTMVDNVFDRFERFSREASLPADGTEFTLYEMVPTTYRAERQSDGSVLFKVVTKDKEEKDADTAVQAENR